MLFYTDGLIEARDADGTFFPLTNHLHRLKEGSLEEALDALIGRLLEHTGQDIRDDMALVLAENRG